MLYDDLIKFVEDNLYIFKHKVIVVVENSIYIQNVRATIGISQTVAASKLVFNKFGAAVFGIDNKSWKKDVLASGKAEKSLIKKFALTKWPDDLNETMDQDFFDAACIAYYGFSKFGK
ncbi:hypothetical protein HYS94_01790 [Candidatus Daviesbacteria bacterium]|nr:hypothetical protein [Candidatus Daviesbacteria bacterium]